LTAVNGAPQSPRAEDTEPSLYALAQECVEAGGTANMRENIALYFVAKRLMQMGVTRETVDARAAQMFAGTRQPTHAPPRTRPYSCPMPVGAASGCPAI
jgi:hypothetical protein